MLRLAIKIFTAVACLSMALTSHAEPFSSNSRTNGLTPTLSPESFKNAVNQANTQTQNNLAQQAKDALSKYSNSPTPAPAPSQTAPTDQPDSTSISNTTSDSSTKSAQPTNSNKVINTPRQTDTYTGFSGGSSGQRSGKSSSGSGRLKIGY